MIRDERRDEAYFERYITVQKKRIETFRSRRAKPGENDVQKEKLCDRFLANFYKDLFFAQYSAGASKAELTGTVRAYLSLVSSCGIQSYGETVDVLALAELFDLDKRKAAALVSEAFCDPLVRYLLEPHVLSGQNPAEELCFSEYQSFYDFATDRMTAEQFGSYMENTWYDSCKERAFYDSHKSNQDIYVGYWSLPAAALFKRKGQRADQVAYVPWELCQQAGLE